MEGSAWSWCLVGWEISGISNNRPFAASHWRGTKPPCWRGKVALGEDKQRKLPFEIMYPFCLSPCPRVTWMANCKGPIFDRIGNRNPFKYILFWLTTDFNWLKCKKLSSNNGGTLYFSPPPPPPEKKERKISKVKFNFTYRPSWFGESYCDAFCWKSRWNWPFQHSQQVFAFPYAISLIRVRFKQFRKGDHLTAICIKYYLIT